MIFYFLFMNQLVRVSPAMFTGPPKRQQGLSPRWGQALLVMCSANRVGRLVFLDEVAGGANQRAAHKAYHVAARQQVANVERLTRRTG